jgi:1-acyl-sn-glycerol-3-phosphate acyltransferase
VADEPVVVVSRLVASLVEELHPSAVGPASLSGTTSLDGDLGLDSLARVELLHRMRGAFGDAVSAAAVFGADCLADLVAAVEEVRPGEHLAAAVRAIEAPAPDTPVLRPPAFVSAGQRREARSVPALLARLVERDPGFVCIRLAGPRGEEEALDAGSLWRGARRVASGLSARIAPGDRIALMLPTGRDFVEALLGIQLAGGIPVPLPPATRPSQIADHLERQIGILDDCGASLLVASREVRALAQAARLRASTVRRVVTCRQLADGSAEHAVFPRAGSEVALLQYTSGSTGAPKGVVLSHSNLLANLEAIAGALETGSDDVFVSWLPLYHDMGLIGGLLHPLYCGIPLVLMSPLTFLGRPQLWVEAIDRHRGTMTVAPNFAYEICQRRAGEVDLPALDLSSWRLALNGAEPVSPGTIDRFCARFGPFGFRREAMLPVYGLAENTLAVTFPPLARGPRVDRVRRDGLVARGVAEPVTSGGGADGALAFVSCGRPLEGVDLRVVDPLGREVGAREVGRVQFRGTSATSGYFGNREATRQLFDGPWIDSGDLGYLVGGELHLTGRSKDIVIHAGRNLSPHSLEEAAGEVEGVRRGCVAAFGVLDDRQGTERLVVVAETRETGAEARRSLVAAVNLAIMRVAGTAPDDVCLVAPHTLLKTSSGKIRRLACRELYASGRLARSTRRSAWSQVLGTVASTAAASLRRLVPAVPAALYSSYAWCTAGVLLALAWGGVMSLPRPSWRRAWARAASRGFFLLAGVPVSVSGVRRLCALRQRGAGIVLVANHASYLDSMILIAALDAPLSFVAKRDFERRFVTRAMMRRLGTSFVDPDGGDPRPDLEAWSARVERGEVLVVFAEGTFVRAEGLRPFKLGAFEVARRAGATILPVVIDGSRGLLRDGQWWLRRTPLRVHVCPPVDVPESGLTGIARAARRTRRAMLARLAEPDLAAPVDEGARRTDGAACEATVAEATG